MLHDGVGSLDVNSSLWLHFMEISSTIVNLYIFTYIYIVNIQFLHFAPCIEKLGHILQCQKWQNISLVFTL